jgi:threonine/homoserine/homoserine lactone efflux protein
MLSETQGAVISTTDLMLILWRLFCSESRSEFPQRPKLTDVDFETASASGAAYSIRDDHICCGCGSGTRNAGFNERAADYVRWLGWFWRSLHLTSAEMCGYAISIGLLLAINESLAATFPPLTLVMRSVLAVYLLWLAGRAWNANVHQVEARIGLVSWRRVFVTTRLNPKGVVIALLFPRLPTPSDIAWYGMAFALTALVIGCGWLLFGNTVGRLQGSRAVALLPRLTAVVLLAFAAIAAGSAILGAVSRGPPLGIKALFVPSAIKLLSETVHPNALAPPRH